MKYIGFLAVVLFAVLLCVPLFWMISGSFQLSEDLGRMPPRMITGAMTLENYLTLFRYPVFRWTFNSIIVAISSVALSLMINITAGYAFAKKKFRGKEAIFYIFIMSMVIPGQITLIPSFMIIRELGLYNTLWAIILPSGVSAFMVFFFRQHLEGIPNEYFDMATIDGCNEINAFIRIMIPLSMPAIMTMMLLTFTGVWIAFLWPMIVITKEELLTLPVGVAILIIREAIWKTGMPDPALGFAGATYAFVPVLLVFIFGQKYYVRGLFSGGIKG